MGDEIDETEFGRTIEHVLTGVQLEGNQQRPNLSVPGHCCMV